MSQFEFVFSLFGLLLGLSLAEVLGGFGKAVKARRRLRIGWLTPLLGILVMLDLTSFWTTAWAARDLLPVNYLTLMLLLAFTGLYYLAATLVFPEDVSGCVDFDEHYWLNRRFVVGAVLLLNLPDVAFDLWTGELVLHGWVRTAILVGFFALLAGVLLANGKRASIILLVTLIVLYPVTSTLGALGLL
jgi:hypothetical protein